MATLVTDGFDPGEDKTAVSILKKWKGGALSDSLFTVLAGMIPQPIVEVVVLRRRFEYTEALIIPRPEGDIVWPGMYHTPGQVLRASDFRRADGNPLNGPFERIQQRELGGVKFQHEPVFVGVVNASSERGAGVSQIFWVKVDWLKNPLPEGTLWEDADTLADNPKFIQSQMSFIPKAVKAFKSWELEI